MTYQEILDHSRTQIGPYCKSCKICNGLTCKNTIPGPGAKGDIAVRNYEAWQQIRVNMDTICENGPADTTFDFFGHRLALPVMAGPVGAMQLHYGDRYNDMEYNDLLVAACAKAGILAFTGDGTDPDFPAGMTGSLKSLPRGQRIEAAITKFCAERTVDEVEAIMNKAGIPNQKAFGPADIEKSAQFAAREDIATWKDSIFGDMKGVGITNKFKKNPAQIVASAPTFGEHSREILSFLGYSEEEIDDMYAKGETATMDARETAELWHFKDWGFFWRPDQAQQLEL